jgi:hypothetical protein
MRAASHIDFRTAVKMSQQASACSGFPMLTPLPTYNSQISDECYSYTSNADQDLPGYSRNVEPNSFALSGRLTPETPESLVYHEPLSIGDMADQWMAPESWSEDSLASVGLGFGGDMTAMLPTELWPSPEQTHSASLSQASWYPSSLSESPQHMSSEPVPDARSVPSLSISECSAEDFNNSGAFHEDWANCQQTTPQFDMTDMTTSAPYAHALNTIPSTTPSWEDVYMSGSVRY